MGKQEAVVKLFVETKNQQTLEICRIFSFHFPIGLDPTLLMYLGQPNHEYYEWISLYYFRSLCPFYLYWPFSDL